MTRAFSGLLLAGLLAALIPHQPARAEAPKDSQPRTFAVLVGVSQYSDKQIKPRPKAEADIKALYQVLTNKDYKGIDPKNVKLLLGEPGKDGEKATRANFLKALKWVAAEAGPKDLVYFAFIGQGGPTGDSGERRCYFLADSTFKSRDKDAVGAEEIEDALKKLKGKLCAFLDLDFKGFVPDPKARIAEPTLGKAPYREFLGDDATEDHNPLTGRVAFLATTGLSTSLDLKDHGLFTTVLLDGLKGKADSQGYEPDGLVTVDELGRYLYAELPKLARKNGKTDAEKDQDPIVLPGPSTHFVVTTNPTAGPTRTKRLAKLETLIKDKELTGAFIDEGRALLDRMPNLKKRQDMRKLYQELVDDKLKLEKFKEKHGELLASMKLKDSEAQHYAKKVLDAIDLLKEEYVKKVEESQLVVWAIRELYTYLEEPLPKEVDAELKKASTLDEKGLKTLLAKARLGLGKREDLDSNRDLNITLLRMMRKLDPHTTYIDPETAKKFREEIEGKFRGIGIQIRKDLATDQLLVVTPLMGSPAYKAKLWAGDLITTIIRQVDDKGNKLDKPEEITTKGLSLNKAVSLIKGMPDTSVKLRIQREGVDKPLDVEITRADIEVESVLGAKRKATDEWDFVIDHANKIGYVRLTSFAENSYAELKAAMDHLMKKEKIKGFILDLRFNPGGLLKSATDITDLFIDDGLIVSIRGRTGRKDEIRFVGKSAGSLLDFPMVCLINGSSASGSEIVSAALQDHKRAVIVGERSYGKGSVQNVRKFEVPDYAKEYGLEKVPQGEIKLTSATFWRPNGENLNKLSTNGRDDEKWGVIPDKVIKLTPKERRDLAEHQYNLQTIERPDRRGKNAKSMKDRQLEAALEYLRGQIKLAGRAAK